MIEKFKIENYRKGFTLIELLVVIAIIGILSAIVLVNTGQNPDRDVRQEKDRFTAFLRSVQNKTLTAESVTGATGKVCGFGVHFNSKTEAKVYYVETKDDVSTGKKALDVDCSDTIVIKTDPGDSYISDSFQLGHNTQLNNFNTDPPKDLFFLIPNGEVYYGGNPANSSGNEPIIVIQSTSDLNTQVPTTIFPTGLIE